MSYQMGTRDWLGPKLELTKEQDPWMFASFPGLFKEEQDRGNKPSEDH